MPNALRTATPMGDWRSFKFINASGVTLRGVKSANADAIGARISYLYLIRATVGALLEDAANGAEGVLIYHAEKILVPKKTELVDTFLPGDRVYWDPVTRLVTPAYNSAYLWIGIATEPAARGDLRVEIDLRGERAEVELVLPA